MTYEALSKLTKHAEALAAVLLQNRIAIGVHGKQLLGTDAPAGQCWGGRTAVSRGTR